MNFVQKLALVLTSTGLLLGCNEEQVSHTSFGKYEKEIDFILPNENLIRYSNPETMSLQRPRSPWTLTSVKREHGKWQVWVLTNYFSDKDEGATRSYKPRSGDAMRKTGAFVESIALFKRHTGLPFDVNVVAYGSIPQLFITPPNHPKQGTLARYACGGGFRLCADNFYLAPAARFEADIQGQNGLTSWYKFADHVMQPTEPLDVSPNGRAFFHMKKKQWLSGGETNQHLNNSPDMVFIVSPEGKAHYGWTSYGSSGVATDLRVRFALLEVFGKQNDKASLDRWINLDREYVAATQSWHGLHASDEALGNLANKIQRLADFVFSTGQ